jgi:hypothetical protein
MRREPEVTMKRLFAGAIALLFVVTAIGAEAAGAGNRRQGRSGRWSTPAARTSRPGAAG